MLEMILKQGDWEALEGRAVVYSIFQPEVTADPIIIAAYTSCNTEDFLRKVNMSVEELHTARTIIMGRQTKEQKRAPQKFHHAFLHNISHENALPKECDILYVPNEFSSPDRCKHAILLASQYYALRYLDQQDGNRKVLPEDTRKRTYKDYSDADLKRYILREYLIPLMRARGKPREFQVLADDLHRFSGGSRFADYSSNLCSEILGGTVKGRTLRKHTDVMIALKGEDYITAAQIRKTIPTT